MQQSPYCSFLGLDRSDRKTDITSRSPDGHQAVTDSILAKPRKWLAWIEQLRQRYPTGRFALCVEMPAANIVAFFSQFDFIDIFPINPSTLSNFREAFVTSRCKDDPTDSWWLSELVRVHQDKLTVWEPDTAQSRLLMRLVEDRRGVVAHRTRLSNQLKDLLKTSCINGPPCRPSKQLTLRPSSSSTTNTAASVRAPCKNVCILSKNLFP